MIDERVLAIEARANAVPGTTFSRCLLDASICKDHDIELTYTEMNKGCALVWCLAVGPMQMPKFMIYARRIDECVSKAEIYDSKVVQLCQS